MSTATAVVGAQWGDEGKGRIVDALAKESDFVVRYQGGANAGHTINNHLGRFVLSLLPSGVFYPDVVNVLGPGVALDIEAFFSELQSLQSRGISPKLAISDRAQIVMPFHKALDVAREEGGTDKKFGSTKKGIAPFYSGKFAKRGLRVGELLHAKHLGAEIEEAVKEANFILKHFYGATEFDIGQLLQFLEEWRERLRPFVIDSTEVLFEALRDQKQILLEGQLGAMRDPDHGIYPYSTSSSPLAGNATVGAGIPAYAIKRVIAVAKAYSSKVGVGPFVVGLGETEQGQQLRRIGGDKGEFGAVTGRPRDVGFFDAVATRYGCRVQGATEIALTCLDVLGDFSELPICTGYRIGGEITNRFPVNSLLDEATPVYETLPGWRMSKEALGGFRSFASLPDNARRFVDRIEELCEVPIKIISVGPERDAMIVR
jgi:adenylosuccinate synthase